MRKSVLAAVVLSMAVAGVSRVGWGDDAGMYKVSKAEVVTDFSGDLQEDEKNVAITLILPDAVKKNVALVTTLVMKDGVWSEKNAAGVSGLFPPLQVTYGPPAPPQKGNATVKDLVLSKDGLKGTVVIELTSMEWQKKRVHLDGTWEVSLDLKRTGKTVAAKDPDPTTPTWRKNNARATGWELTGNFSAKGKDGEVSGVASAGVGVRQTGEKFGTDGNAVIEKAAGGGMKLTANLGEIRINDSAATANVVRAFEKPLDLRGFDGLRVTIDTKGMKRRDEVVLSLALQEGRGAWYGVNNAGFVTGDVAEFIVPFEDFQAAGGYDDDSWLDLGTVKGLKFGVNNAFGIGEVALNVRKIEAVKWKDAEEPARKGAVEVFVKPNVRVAHGGDYVIPKGLFGVHDVSPTTPKTEEEKAKMLAYAKQVKPGFLRQIDHVGFSGKPITDEEIKAAQQGRIDAAKGRGADFVPSFQEQRQAASGASDSVMKAATTNLWARPPWMDMYARGEMQKFLDGVTAFYRIQGKDAWVKGDDYNAYRLIEVWNEPFMWARHMNKHEAKFQDPTQFSDVPGKFIADIYSDIFKAAVKGVRSANPDVKVGGPCSGGYAEDHFANGKNFVMRFIDNCHEQIDFLAEHHYQGRPDSYAAAYDVITAYTDGKYGKRIPIYNTESNDLIDTPNKGDKKEDQPFDENSDQMNRAYYNAKDILTMAREIPDVAKGRALHALWSGYFRNKGETDVYTLLSDLRGEVVEVESGAKGVVSFATRRGDEVVLVVVNDSDKERTFTVPSLRFYRAGKVTQTTLTYKDGTKLDTAEVKEGDKVALHKRGMVKWVFSGVRWVAAPAEMDVVKDQRRFYANEVFVEVKPGAGRKLGVKLPAEMLEKAESARLRVVTLDVQRGEGKVKVGGMERDLPASGGSGQQVVQYVPLDVKGLKAGAELEFEVGNGDRNNGYEVLSASIVLTVEGGMK